MYLQDTKHCGVEPSRTSMNSYILIGVFLLVALVSCIFEVLISRLRSRMCNVFYTDRAQERADYLHFRISSGRVNRRTILWYVFLKSTGFFRPCTYLGNWISFFR